MHRETSRRLLLAGVVKMRKYERDNLMLLELIDFNVYLDLFLRTQSSFCAIFIEAVKLFAFVFTF